MLAIAMLVLVACNSATTPASQTQFDLPGVLIQEAVEFLPYAFHPYGRVPEFTPMDNGRLIYLDEGKRFDQQRIMEGDMSVQILPLDGSWLEPPPGREQSWATVIDGDELKALLSNLSRNTGGYWFRSSGRTYQAYLVPWLLGVDYADDVAGYGQ